MYFDIIITILFNLLNNDARLGQIDEAKIRKMVEEMFEKTLTSSIAQGFASSYASDPHELYCQSLPESAQIQTETKLWEILNIPPVKDVLVAKVAMQGKPVTNDNGEKIVITTQNKIDALEHTRQTLLKNEPLAPQSRVVQVLTATKTHHRAVSAVAASATVAAAATLIAAII